MNSPCKPFAEGTKCRRAQPGNAPKKQHGVVLFIALIALVVMSLAAVALIRSVDTNTMIAGNLAFKQAAISSADIGLETAIVRLAAKATGGETAFDADDLANGYYSFTDPVADPKLRIAASAKPAVGTDITAGKDSSGNTVSYVVERLCRVAGTASTANCLYGAPTDPTSSKGVKDVSGVGALDAAGTSVMFRVTVSVAGPKNTLGFIQAYVY